MSSVARSQRILDGLVGKNGLTEAGKNWIAGAADPFHDLALNVTGYPDQCQSDSVVQLVKLTTTIQCPTSITSGTWDCRVHQYPWLVEVPMTTVSNAGATNAPAFAFTGSTGVFKAGGLCYDIVPTGTNMSAGQGGTGLHGSITLPSQYYNGQVRVVGQAFEVHNTTSVLNKQGAVCVYKQPTPDMFQGTTYPVLGGSASTNGIGYPSSILLPTPPYALADALLLSGSKQWEAKDGCYVVGSFHSANLPLQDTIVLTPITYQANVPEGTGTYYMPNPGQVQNGTSTILFWNDLFWSQQDAHGAYFTGLSLQTSLVVNWNILIERFPSAADADLVVLAKPSPRYDPIAIELYSLCMQNMPVGVPVAENGLGDWFMKVIGRARDIAMPALRAGALVHPKLKLLTGAMDVLGVSGNASGGGAQSNPSPWQGGQKGQQKQKQKGSSQRAFGPFAPGTKQIHNMAKIISRAEQKAAAAVGNARTAKKRAKRQAKKAAQSIAI